MPSATAIEPAETVLRSQPWWQRVSTLEGAGATGPEPITIDDGAIQRRVRWSREVGELRASADGGSEPVVGAACPGESEGYAIEWGPTSREVEADGPRRLEAEQQINVPLIEAPKPAMGDPSMQVVATGAFYRMDQSGTGTVAVFRLDDGSHAFRLEDFCVTPNVELAIHLSPLEAPHQRGVPQRSLGASGAPRRDRRVDELRRGARRRPPAPLAGHLVPAHRQRLRGVSAGPDPVTRR